MTRYYLVFLVIMILVSALLYYRTRSRNIPPKAFASTAGISIIIGAIFPLLAGRFHILTVIAFILVVICLGTYAIVRFWGNEWAAAGIKDEGLEELTALDFQTEETEEKIEEIEEDIAEIAETDEVEEEVEEVEEVDEEVDEEVVEEVVVEEDEDEEVDAEVEEDVEDQELEKEPEPQEQAEEQTGSEFDQVAASEEGDADMGRKHIRAEDEQDLRDSYISRGFEAKSEGKLDLAVKYFTSAMELHPPEDLEVMLVFDICAMLRELGQYKKSREFLEQFSRDRGSRIVPTLAEEVQIQLKYMDLLVETLEKANTPSLPFSKVPVLIKVSVEEKVNRWKNEALKALI